MNDPMIPLARPKGGGKTATVATTPATVITLATSGVIPRGAYLTVDGPCRLGVFTSTAAQTINDANFGYFPAGSYPLTFVAPGQDGGDKSIQIAGDGGSVTYKIGFLS